MLHHPRYNYEDMVMMGSAVPGRHMYECLPDWQALDMASLAMQTQSFAPAQFGFSQSGDGNERPHKRRKVADKDGELSMSWDHCVGENGDLRFYDGTRSFISTVQVDVSLDRGVSYDRDCDAWLAYRRNHINMTCHMRVEKANGEEARVAFVEYGGHLFPVEGMTVEVFGADVTERQLGVVPTKRVELYQTSSGRSQKVGLEPVPIACNAHVNFSRLHFKFATANNARVSCKSKANQQFVSLVVALRVHLCGLVAPPIVAKALVSPPLIVRSGNPSMYRNVKDAEPVEPKSPSVQSPNSDEVRDGTPPDLALASEAGDIPLGPALGLREKREMAIATRVGPGSERTEMSPTSTGPAPSFGRMPIIVEEKDCKGQWIPGAVPGSVVRYGNVGINTDTPEEALVVHGNVRVAGTVFQPSDERIKENIESLDTEEQLERVRKLRLVSYDLKPAYAETVGATEPHADIGFIAQEVAEVMPAAVSKMPGALPLKDGTEVPQLLAVDRDAIFMANVGATQELDKKVEVIAGDVTELYDKVGQLAQEASSGKASSGKAGGRGEGRRGEGERPMQDDEEVHPEATSSQDKSGDPESGLTRAGSLRKSVITEGLCSKSQRVVLILVALTLASILALVVLIGILFAPHPGSLGPMELPAGPHLLNYTFECAHNNSGNPEVTMPSVNARFVYHLTDGAIAFGFNDAAGPINLQSGDLFAVYFSQEKWWVTPGGCEWQPSARIIPMNSTSTLQSVIGMKGQGPYRPGPAEQTSHMPIPPLFASLAYLKLTTPSCSGPLNCRFKTLFTDGAHYHTAGYLTSYNGLFFNNNVTISLLDLHFG